jgi:hypothetical protein
LPKGTYDKLKKHYQPAWLTHVDYPDLVPQGEDVPTISVSSMLVVYVWPTKKPRYQQAAKFVELFFNNLRTLRKTPHHPRWREVNPVVEVPGWKRFPPAEKWLQKSRRNGMMTATFLDETDVKMNVAFQKFITKYSKATGKPVDQRQKQQLYAEFIRWWSKHNR